MMRPGMGDLHTVHPDITDQEVLAAMAVVPRHEFVPEDYAHQAYEDHPLPIGYGQTISQPYIVALMTQLLEIAHEDKVLEIGTGSGYQAAILAQLVREVYSVEIIEPLAQQSAERLRRLGYSNVFVRHADGYFGWEEHAPFDAIIVTAAVERTPRPLIDQLRDGGRLVVPVGASRESQMLYKATRSGQEVIHQKVTSVIFVPFTRK